MLRLMSKHMKVPTVVVTDKYFIFTFSIGFYQKLVQFSLKLFQITTILGIKWMYNFTNGITIAHSIVSTIQTLYVFIIHR
jgi:hypothetical protein